jgi:hypothetical protein
MRVAVDFWAFESLKTGEKSKVSKSCFGVDKNLIYGNII